MYGIWDLDTKDWVREITSSVDNGGVAVLAFESKREACKRAAKYFAFESYTDAKKAGWCEVRPL